VFSTAKIQLIKIIYTATSLLQQKSPPNFLVATGDIFFRGCKLHNKTQQQFLLFVASAMLSHGSFPLQSGSHSTEEYNGAVRNVNPKTVFRAVKRNSLNKPNYCSPKP
jgi:hypothetical protein